MANPKDASRATLAQSVEWSSARTAGSSIRPGLTVRCAAGQLLCNVQLAVAILFGSLLYRRVDSLERAGNGPARRSSATVASLTRARRERVRGVAQPQLFPLSQAPRGCHPHSRQTARSGLLRRL